MTRSTICIADLSLAQLAKKMKTSPPYISPIQDGKAGPSNDARERFARETRTRLGIAFRRHAAR
jgi:hypothetical protein